MKPVVLVWLLDALNISAVLYLMHRYAPKGGWRTYFAQFPRWKR